MPDQAARRVAVVLNGLAGALLDQPDAIESLRTAFAEVGLKPDFIPHDAGSLPERIKQAAAGGAEAVIVGGGDGTVACAAQTLAGGDMPLGVLPFGTMNLLAKDLGIPVGDTPGALRVLAAGRVEPIDVADVNGHVFLCASMLGLPVRLGRHREAQRGASFKPLAWAHMAVQFLRTIDGHRRMRATVEVGGRTLRLRASSLTITANTLDDQTGRVFGRSSLDGGTLALYVIRHLTFGRILALAWGVLRSRWRRDPAVNEHRGRTIVVGGRNRRMTVMNDGEMVELDAPLTYTIRPGTLRVIVP